jgi:3'(2'), 5'-bisphosphate nucleotidase
VSASPVAALLPELVALARAASEVVLRVYKGEHVVRRKADASPVTEADEASEAIILAGLKRLTPDIPAISEEAAERGDFVFDPARPPPQYWLVDPVDGTKEFVNRTGEFTINIGLVEDAKPVLGVLHAPLANVTYAAAGPRSAVVYRGSEPAAPIWARPAPPQGLVVLGSRSHGNKPAVAAYLEDFTVAEQRTLGSAIKFALIAEGVADLYPRFGPTMEWDTCAGHAILQAAGGKIATLSGASLLYGKPGFLNPDFVARGAWDLPAGV